MYKPPSNLLHAAFLVVAVLFCNVVHGQINTSSPTIVTNFASGIVLSPAQIQTVLELAAKCGLKQPAEVQTFHVFHGMGVGINVRSAEHVDGRKVAYEEVMLIPVQKYLPYNQTDLKDLELKGMACDPTMLQTLHMLSVTIKNKQKKICVDKDMTVETADKIIGDMTTGRADFEGVNSSGISNKSEFNRIDMSDLRSLVYDKENKQYHMMTGRVDGYILRCKIENGRVVIVSIGQWDQQHLL